jgi:hypothetical protein
VHRNKANVPFTNLSQWIKSRFMTIRRTLPKLFILAVFALMAVVIASRLGVVDLPRKYDPFALPDLDETPHWLTSTQLKLLDFEPENCKFALANTGLPASLRPAKAVGTSCELSGIVLLSRLSAARLKPEETRCNIAARLYMWEKHVLQPAALSYFHEPVAEILHFGSFSCRTIAGSSYMSEHAHANAFDISAFKLKSGKVISVLKDWSPRTTEMKFLHAARDGACDYFNLTLSPDYNAAHKDHFHVDMGWVRGCN